VPGDTSESGLLAAEGGEANRSTLSRVVAIVRRDRLYKVVAF
jgi:hypothetical protein